MSSKSWSWMGALSVGTSHVSSGKGCEDFAACVEVPTSNGTALLMVVSDGAGSAKYAKLGSRAVVRGLVRSARSFFASGNRVSALAEETVRSWIDDIRDDISALADACSAQRRDFAATMVAAIADDENIAICHIGDGACVLRKDDYSSWEVPSWPSHGEYASSTYFVTDDPSPRLNFCLTQGAYESIAAFSDGIERLVLDFSARSAGEQFFSPMAKKLSNQHCGRDRALSKGLREFLDSHVINDRTDDDKTLLIARRILGQ